MDISAGSMELYRMGFLDGFQMALNGHGKMGRIEPKEKRQPEDPTEQTYVVGNDPDTFLTVIQNSQGKRIRFSKKAAQMLGEYDRADIYVRNGNIYIYPTKEGQYTISRAPSSGCVTICCSSVIDEISADGNRYRIEQRDNHLIAVKAA